MFSADFKKNKEMLLSRAGVGAAALLRLRYCNFPAAVLKSVFVLKKISELNNSWTN